MDDQHQIEESAESALGYTQLRPGQEEAVAGVVDGRDTLVVMPTGAGKSAIYQLAATLVDGPTVVVSPLIALQRDQVEALHEQDAGAAAEANSTLAAGERRETFHDLRAGELEFLFLAPEQFNNPETLEQLRQAQPRLFVVDEAHCISDWGHDFRPDYLRLGAVAEELGRPTILALTATAAPPVRSEIVERLRMRDAAVIVHGFDRPNIHLSARRFEDDDAKSRALLALVGRAQTPGIVYVATRRHAEELAQRLRDDDIDARAYHGGMGSGERDETQAAFMDGDIDVVVPTVAFGMGIDKADVRFVYHHDITGSVDSYYQQIGRAGRDGGPAEAVLFYRPQDLGLQRFLTSSGRVDSEQIEKVASAVQDADGASEVAELRDDTDLSQRKVRTALSRLETIGAVDVAADGQVTAAEHANEPDEAAAAAVHAEDARRRLEQSRIEMMRGYAETRDCRRAFLLNYFGEQYDAPCGNCDNCEAGLVDEDDAGERPFPLNSRVRHAEWGDGLVMRYDDGRMVVLFDEVGYKTLLLEAVAERDLLHKAG